MFVLKSRIPWEMLPQEMGCGSGMSCWRRLKVLRGHPMRWLLHSGRWCVGSIWRNVKGIRALRFPLVGVLEAGAS